MDVASEFPGSTQCRVNINLLSRRITTLEKTMNANLTHTPTPTPYAAPAAPAIVVPSISSSAVLIDMSISVWTGRKMDKRASEDVTTQNNAAKGVANVNKKLLGDCAELDALQKFAANARNTHYAMTTPWSDLGLRLCPTQMYINRYEKTMSELQTEFFRLAEAFYTAYEWEVQNAQLKLGKMWNGDEYPTVEKLREKFRFRYTAMPVPEAGDWRLDVGAEAAASMRTQYESFYGEKFKEAMGDVWQRTYEALSKMSERLDYGDDANKKIFRDSLVSNVKDMVQMLSDFNITNDPVMAKASQDLERALEGVTPEALREDAYLRAQTKQHVDAVRKTIDSLGLGW